MERAILLDHFEKQIEYMKGLDTKQLVAIQNLTHIGIGPGLIQNNTYDFEKYNKIARTKPRSEWPKEMLAQEKILDSVMGKVPPLKEDLVVYRAIGDLTSKTFDEITKNSKELPLYHYVSASTSDRYAKLYATYCSITFVIKLSKGARVLPMFYGLPEIILDRRGTLVFTETVFQRRLRGLKRYARATIYCDFVLN
jgi:hypothetical protein